DFDPAMSVAQTQRQRALPRHHLDVSLDHEIMHAFAFVVNRSVIGMFVADRLAFISAGQKMAIRQRLWRQSAIENQFPTAKGGGEKFPPIPPTLRRRAVLV